MQAWRRHVVAIADASFCGVGWNHAMPGIVKQQSCQQVDITSLPLVAAYRSIFSERYRALAGEITSAVASITQLFGETALARLETLAEQNKAAVAFWSQYCTL